eukprot:g48312.t1
MNRYKGSSAMSTTRPVLSYTLTEDIPTAQSFNVERITLEASSTTDPCSIHQSLGLIRLILILHLQVEASERDTPGKLCSGLE